MSMAPATSFFRHTRGSTLPEAAIILTILLPMLLGGMEIGLMMWTKGTLQSVAAMAARCIAINSPTCTLPTTSTPTVLTQQYAVNLATYWLGSGMIVAANVSVTTSTTCNGSPGTFDVVTITASPWANSIIYPDKSHTDTLTACYPI